MRPTGNLNCLKVEILLKICLNTVEDTSVLICLFVVDFEGWLKVAQRMKSSKNQLSQLRIS